MSSREFWPRAGRWVMAAAAAVPYRLWRVGAVCTALAWVTVLALDLLA